MSDGPRDYRPLVSVAAFELFVGVWLFSGRIADALLGRESLPWSGFEIGLAVALVLGLCLAGWLWVRANS